MLGIDTNVLVRYIVQDDKEQSKLASDLIEGQCSENNLGYINLIVVCELVWVLDRAYGYDKSLIAGTLEQILVTDTFEVQSSEIVWKTLRDYRNVTADFSDLIIAHINEDAGVKQTYTFDKKAGKTRLFALLT